MTRRFSRAAISALDWLYSNVAAAALLAIVVINGCAVVARYVFDAPFSWSEEVMRYANIWLAFLGAASAFVADEHMAIELPFLQRQRWIKRLAATLRYGCAIVLAAAAIWLGTRGAIANLAQRSPSAGIVMAIPYAAVPVGAALILLAAAYKLAATWIPGLRNMASDGAEPEAE